MVRVARISDFQKFQDKKAGFFHFNSGNWKILVSFYNSVAKNSKLSKIENWKLSVSFENSRKLQNWKFWKIPRYSDFLSIFWNFTKIASSVISTLTIFKYRYFSFANWTPCIVLLYLTLFFFYFPCVDVNLKILVWF